MIYYIYFVYFLSTAFVESVYGRHFFCYPVGWICPQHHLLNIAVCCEPAQCVSIETVKQTYSETKRNISYMYNRCKIRIDSAETIKPISEIHTESLKTGKHKSMIIYDTLGIKNKSISHKNQAYNINKWLRKLEKSIQQQQHTWTKKYVGNETENYTESTVDSTMKLVDNEVNNNISLRTINSRDTYLGANSSYQQHSQDLLKNYHFSQEDLKENYNRLRSRVQKRSIDKLNSEMQDGSAKMTNNIVLKILDNIQNHTNNEHKSENLFKNSALHDNITNDIKNSVRNMEKNDKEHKHKVGISNEYKVATDNTEWAFRKRYGGAGENNTKSKLKLNLTLTEEPDIYFKKNSYKNVKQYKNYKTKLKHVDLRNKLHSDRSVNETLNMKGPYMTGNKKYVTVSNHTKMKNIGKHITHDVKSVLKTVTSETSLFLTQDEMTITEVPIHITGNMDVSTNTMKQILTGKKHNFTGNKLNDNDFVEAATLNVIIDTTLRKHKKSLINENSDNMNTDAIQTQTTNGHIPIPVVSSTLHNIDVTAEPEIYRHRLSRLLRTKSTVEDNTPVRDYTSNSPHISIQHNIENNTITTNVLHRDLRGNNSSANINNISNIRSIGTQELLRENTSFTIQSIDNSVTESVSNSKTNQKSETENKVTTVNTYISNEITTLENLNYNTEVVMLENIVQNDVTVSDNVQNEVTTDDNLKAEEVRVGEITTDNFHTKATVSVNTVQTEIIPGDAKENAATIGNIIYNVETTFEDVLQNEITTFKNFIHSEVVAAAENLQTEINSEKLHTQSNYENIQNELTIGDNKIQKETINENSVSRTATDKTILQTEEVESVENVIHTYETTVDSALQNEVTTFEYTVANEVTMPESTMMYTIVTVTENDINFTENNLQNTENNLQNEDENAMKNEETSSDTVVQNEMTTEENEITVFGNVQNEISTDENKKFEITEDEQLEVTTIPENFTENHMIIIENMLSSETKQVENIGESFLKVNKTKNDIVDEQQNEKIVQTEEHRLRDNDTRTSDVPNNTSDITQNEVDLVDEENCTNNAGTLNIMNNNSITTFPVLEDTINDTDTVSDVQVIKMQDTHIKPDGETNEISPNINIAKDELKISNITDVNLMRINNTDNTISISADSVTNETNFDKNLADKDLNEYEFVTPQEFTENNTNEKKTENVHVDEEIMNNETVPVTASVDWINNGSDSAVFIVDTNKKSHSHEHLYDNRNNVGLSEELMTYNNIYHTENETVPEVLPNPESFHGNISDLGDSLYSHDNYYQDENSSYVSTDLDRSREYYHRENGSITDYGHEGSTGNESNNTQENSLIHDSYNSSGNKSKENEQSSYYDFHKDHYHDENENNSIHDVLFAGNGHFDHNNSKDENNVQENIFEHIINDGYHDSENVSNLQDNQYTGFVQNVSVNNQESDENGEHGSYNQHKNRIHTHQEFVHDHDVYNDIYVNDNSSVLSELSDRVNTHSKILNRSDIHEGLRDYNTHGENISNADNEIHNHVELHDTQNDIHDNLNIQSQDYHSENGSVIHADELDSEDKLHEISSLHKNEDGNDVEEWSHEIINTGLEDTFGARNRNVSVNSSNKTKMAFVDNLGVNDNNINQLERLLNETSHNHEGTYSNSVQENSTDSIHETISGHENLSSDDSQRPQNNNSYMYEGPNEHDLILHDDSDRSLHEALFRNVSYSDMQHNDTYDIYDEHSLNTYIHDNNSYAHKNLQENDDYGGYNPNEKYTSHYDNSSDHFENVNKYESKNHFHDDFYEHGGNYSDHEYHNNNDNNNATGISYDHNENVYNDNVDYHDKRGNVNYDDNEGLYYNETRYGDDENHHNESNYENMDHINNADYNTDNEGNADNMDNAGNEGNTDNIDNGNNEGNADNMDNGNNEGNTDNMDNGNNEGNTDNMDNTDNIDRHNTDNAYRDTNTYNNVGGLQPNINIPNIINDFLKSRGKDDSSSENDSGSKYEDAQPEKEKVTIKKPKQQRFITKRASINGNKNRNNIAIQKSKTTITITTTTTTTTTMKPTFINTMAKPSEVSTTTEEDVPPEDERSLAIYLSQNKSTVIPLLTNVVEIHPWTFILDTKVETIPLNLTSSEEAALHH